MIQVLERAAAILEIIRAEGSLPFAEIQRKCGLHKATMNNILQTLVSIRYVEKRADGLYGIGPALLDLARGRIRDDVLIDIADEETRRLAEDLGETVTVGALYGGERYTLSKATPERSLVVDGRIEQRPTPYDTATGRVLLSEAGAEVVDRVLAEKGLPGDRWPGVDTEAGFRQALDRICAAGQAEVYSPDRQVVAVAVPVRDPSGVVCAALGVALPAHRYEASEGEIMDRLKATRDRMERSLALRINGRS